MSFIDSVSSDTSLWFTEKDPEEAGKHLISLSEAGEDDNTERRNRAAYNASILEGFGMKGFGAWAYAGKGTGSANIGAAGNSSPLIWNYAAAGLDTLQAKIAGRQEDKAMIEVTDGDWDDHRKAIWSGRLLDGLYAQDHGQYHDVWDLARHAFKICAGVTGSVAAKVVGYPDEDRLVCELHDTLDMFIDHFECSYSNPLTYGEVTWFDPLRLMATTDNKATKEMIWNSREALPEGRGGGTDERTRYMVRLVEGWRCKMGKEDGRYLAATKNGYLISRKYVHNTPPFAFLHGRRSLAGFYGVPVMDRGMRIVERINQILGTLDKAERLTPRSAVMYDTRATPTELIKNIRDVIQLPYSSETGGHPPQYIVPKIYDESIIRLLEMHVRAFHETLGINSTEMAGQKAQGVVAAVAIRTVADLMSELFSVISRDYQKFVTGGIGGLFLREIGDMAERSPGFAVSWKQGNSRRSVKASMADLKGKKFTFSVQPVSETRNTPADRISMADEMLARKELSPEAYQRVVQTGDLPAETRASDTQYEMTAELIDSWMYDDLEEINNLSPLPWMNLPGAIIQVLDAYMNVLMMRKFDPARENYFRRYITQCDAMMKRQAVEKAKLAAASRGSNAAVGQLDQAPPAEPVV